MGYVVQYVFRTQYAVLQLSSIKRYLALDRCGLFIATISYKNSSCNGVCYFCDCMHEPAKINHACVYANIA